MTKSHAYQLLAAILVIWMATAPSVLAKGDIKSAQAALADGRYQEAVDLLLEAERSDSRNHELKRLLGDAYRGLGDLENAQKAYERALKVKGADREALLKLGETLVELGDTDEAIKVLEKGLNKARNNSGKAAFHHALGRAFMLTENCSEAQKNLLAATIEDESNIEYRLTLGDAYFACEVYTLAKIEYEAVLKEDSANCMVWYRIGVGQFRARMFNDALVSFGNAYLCDSTYTPVYYNLALLYVLSARSQRGDKSVEYYQNALYYFERYREVWPDSNKVLVAKNVSLAYYHLGDAEKAAEELKRAINVGADDPELLFLLARSLHYLAKVDRDSGRVAQSTERFSQAITRFDEYENNLSAADTASAELYRLRAISRQTLFDDTTNSYGADWVQLIIDDYNKSIALDSADAYSISRAGTLLNSKRVKRYEDAKWYFDRMTELFPNEAIYWFNATLPRLSLGQEGEALPFLFAAIEEDTTSAGQVRKKAEEIASTILLKSGELARAKTFFERMVAREPNNCSHLQWLAYCLYTPAVDKMTVNIQAARSMFFSVIPHLEKAYNCSKRRGASACKMRDISLWLATAYTQLEKPDWEKALPVINAGLECNEHDADFLQLKKVYEDTQEIDYAPGSKTESNNEKK